MQFVVDNILFIAIAFVSGGMLLWPLVQRPAPRSTVSARPA